MNRFYAMGRLDGLRQAAELLRGLEANVARRLEREAARKTRDARRVRHKALSVAAKRIETMVRRSERQQRQPIRAALKDLGLGD